MAPRHILVLTDRDWTHPQGGGTGTNLYGQVSRWIAWGHRVTVVAGSHPGAAPFEQLAPNLELHRMGGRVDRLPARRSGPSCAASGRDADVVLEVVNGITFLTPLWLRRPRVTLVHHVHRDHYVAEMGRRGRRRRAAAETLPLRALYRSLAVRDDLRRAAATTCARSGSRRDRIHVSYLGVEQAPFAPAERAAEPRLLYLGRLKQYKRIELLLDVLEGVPAA